MQTERAAKGIWKPSRLHTTAVITARQKATRAFLDRAQLRRVSSADVDGYPIANFGNIQVLDTLLLD